LERSRSNGLLGESFEEKEQPVDANDLLRFTALLCPSQLHCLKSTPWDCSSASEEIDEIQGMMPVEQREAAGDIQVLCGN